MACSESSELFGELQCGVLFMAPKCNDMAQVLIGVSRYRYHYRMIHI
jgi:hypothetical protein